MIIGLTGAMNTGKDSVYSIIQDLTPGAERIAFGDVLKDFIGEAFGYDLEEIEAMKRHDRYAMYIYGQNHGYTMRESLQNIGMAVRKVLGSNIWIDRVLPLTMRHHGRLIVVTDVRMNNEAQRVKDLDGVIWKVTRFGEVQSSHVTEAGIDPSFVDCIIYNETPAQTRSQVQEHLYGTAQSK